MNNRVGPSPEEAHAFIAEYEAARGARFTDAEWEGMAAAATYALAYGAHLEHSLHPDVTDFPLGGAHVSPTSGMLSCVGRSHRGLPFPLANP